MLQNEHHYWSGDWWNIFWYLLENSGNYTSKVLYFHIFIERLRLLFVVARHTADIFLGNIESVLIKWEHKWSYQEYMQDEAQNSKKEKQKQNKKYV